MCGLLEAGDANIERGDEAIIGVVAGGSIVDVAHIANDGDVADVANILTVDAVDVADTAYAVDAGVVEVGVVVGAFAEVELVELGLELQQNPERISVGLQSAQ